MSKSFLVSAFKTSVRTLHEAKKKDNVLPEIRIVDYLQPEPQSPQSNEFHLSAINHFLTLFTKMNPFTSSGSFDIWNGDVCIGHLGFWDRLTL
jgi:hypothetical protein